LVCFFELISFDCFFREFLVQSITLGQMGSNDSEFVMHVYCKDCKERGITLLMTVIKKVINLFMLT